MAAKNKGGNKNRSNRRRSGKKTETRSRKTNWGAILGGAAAAVAAGIGGYFLGRRHAGSGK